MNDINSIRKKLGLTQTELAEYLGITRSYLNLFERKARPIPTPVLLKIADLQIKLSKTSGAPGEIRDPEPPVQKKQAAETNGTVHNKYTLRLDRLALKLSELKDQYNYLEHIRDVLERLLKEHPDEDPNYIYWKMQLEQVLIKMENCKPGVQDKIAGKIIAVTKEAALHKTKIS